MGRTLPHAKVRIAYRRGKGKREFEKSDNGPMRAASATLSTKWSVISKMARAVKEVQYGKTLRKSFARSEEILEMPYLLEIQKKSYDWFFETGLQEVFNDVDSIPDYAGNMDLTFIGFPLHDPPTDTIPERQALDPT